VIRTVRFGLIIVLAGAMSAGAFAQTGIHGPSLSGAQIAGVVAGLAAVTGTVLYFTLRKASIVGCAQSSHGRSSLIDEKDNRTYVLVSDHVALPKTGERFKLHGKKIKGADGKYTFNVKKVGKDYGPCQLMIVR
jgi:hypothetical protein